MQNIAASANLQLFTKALQENAQHPTDSSEHKQQQQQTPAISAADLQQFMLSQIDQQLFLSQLASNNNNNFVSASEAITNNCSSSTTSTSSASSSIIFSTASQTSNLNNNFYSDTEIPSTTTTTSICNNNNNSFLLPKEENNSGESPKQQQQQINNNNELVNSSPFSPNNNNIENERLANLAQQKLVDQLLEAASGGLLNSLENNCLGGNDELGQLMAQLISGSNNRNEIEMQTAQLAQHLVAAANGQRTDVMSPSSSQQQLSLLDQLHLLQMLGGNNSNLAELLSGHQFATSSGNEQQIGQTFVGGKYGINNGGITSSRGSPNKDDTYCEICNKNLCNRYFLKHHMTRKHGIGVVVDRSPVKLGNGNFFGCHLPGILNSDEQQQQIPGRAQSEILLNNRHESPNNTFNNSKTPLKQQQELQHLLCSSTPASVNNNALIGSTSVSASNVLQTSPNGDLISTDQHQQLMGQFHLIKHLASQLGLSTTSQPSALGECSSIVEQLIGACLQIAELLPPQHQSAQRSTPSPDLSQNIQCTQCTGQFPTQTALFHHQLTEHIGTNLEQQNNENNNNNQLNPLAIRWANELNNNNNNGAISSSSVGSSGDGGETTAAQQQQFLNNLLGLNFSPTSTNSSLLLPAFNALNNSELDSTAMLAKLSAELASVSQSSQLGNASGLLFQNGLSLGGQSGQIGSNKPPAPKRQYSSTSKNFCDLCNKEVCNKYFLRTHMLKMHNIVIDENKVVIANIDTTEKERRGEVKFRCEICLCSLTNREQLRAHKREVHGMQAPIGGGGGGASTSTTPSSSSIVGKLPILPSSLLSSSLGDVVEMTAMDDQKHNICLSPTAIKRSNNLINDEEDEGMYCPIKRPKIENEGGDEDDGIIDGRRLSSEGSQNNGNTS
ncbi:hypothetical protein Mgra_00001070 [Meloidogyne graminicola]|uniref:C2H2-type domain-containing protein n=1 Tax=Meloidogyne graminicola TaxID=189291 RepID=A0A8T0A1F5_9BILA|nr:hypothetical protein Mgra_00001070 [Meloidogyne graminicola]